MSTNQPDIEAHKRETARRLATAFRVAKGQAYPISDLEADHRLWLHELLPKHFRSADDQQFALHHDLFFRWGWNIQRAKLPDLPACLWIVNRGGNKSTSAAGLAVALGARQRRKFGLVITRTESQGDTHIRRINSMLLGSNIGTYYPDMARPQVREVSNRTIRSAWNRTQLTTDAGWTLQSFSLQAAQRGVGLEEYRPDFIWLTDVDDEHDTPGMVDTLLNAFSASVLGTRSADCVTIFDQNLIHRDSVLNRILTRQTDVLSDRLTIGPIPAVQEAKYERRHEHWYFTVGRASWPGLPLEACEGILNTVGKDSWEREYQHNVTLAYKDAVYGMFDPVYHFITWEEFAASPVFGNFARDTEGRPRLPALGYCATAQDWGNNPKHPCATRWTWRPSEYMSLTDSVFFYREMCWPNYPVVEQDPRSHPSALRVGKTILEIEKRAGWGEAERMQFRLASHERPEIIEAYRTDLPEAGYEALSFQSVDTSEAREGILHMQSLLTIIEDELHPFRRYPEGHPQAGEPLKGRPRAFFLVSGDQGELYFDQSTGTLAVTPSTDERGQARTAFEYPNYRKPDHSTGEERKDAPKINDDIVDTDRAIAGRVFPAIEALTAAQRTELRLKLLGWGKDQTPLDRREAIFFGMSREYYAQTLAQPEKAKWGLGKRQEGDYDPAGPGWEVAID